METLFQAMTDDMRANIEKLFNIAEKDKEKTAQLMNLVEHKICFNRKQTILETNYKLQ
jgi:hypothetical protein